MTYEQWDIDTGNRAEVADNGDHIFGALREYVEHGVFPVDEPAYRVIDATGRIVETLFGVELAAPDGVAIPTVPNSAIHHS